MYIIVLDDGETWALSSGCTVLKVPPDFFQLIPEDRDQWVKHNFSTGANICVTHCPEFNGDLLVGIEEHCDDSDGEDYDDDDEYNIDDDAPAKPPEILIP